MRTARYVTNFGPLVRALHASRFEWMGFKDFADYLDSPRGSAEEINYSGLLSYKNTGAENITDRELLMRYFYSTISLFEQLKVIRIRRIKSSRPAGRLNLVLPHFQLSAFGSWLYSKPSWPQHCIMFILNITLRLRSFVRRHKWILGTGGAVMTVATVAGYIVETTAYLLVTIGVIIITTLIIGIYKKFADE